MDGIDLTNLGIVLAWLVGTGGPYIAGRVCALLAENWTGWHKLPQAAKVVLPMILSVLLALGATALLQSQATIEQISPWYTLLMTTILGYLGTQEGYMAARKANYGRRAQKGYVRKVEAPFPE